MAKEEKSKFQLNKGTDHGFDISKGGKRIFDLTKDTDEPVASPEKSQPTGTTVEPKTTPEEKSSRKWLWVIAIIIIALLAWWLWPSLTESEDVEEVAVEKIATPADDAADAATDEVTTHEEQPEPNVQSEEEVQTETETSSPTDNTVPTTPSTPESTPNAIPSATVSASVPDAHISNDIEAEALKVIRGDYGVGQERIDKLGTRYQAIQKRVNELKREGAF